MTKMNNHTTKRVLVQLNVPFMFPPKTYINHKLIQQSTCTIIWRSSNLLTFQEIQSMIMSVKIAYPINFCIKNVKCNLLRHAYKLQKTPTNKRGISKECQVHIIKSYQLIPIYATYKLAPLGIKLVIGALHCSSSCSHRKIIRFITSVNIGVKCFSIRLGCLPLEVIVEEISIKQCLDKPWNPSWKRAII